jgi:hypothetical protein
MDELRSALVEAQAGQEPPLALRRSGSGPHDLDRPQASQIASAGLAGQAHALPHGDAIQRSFGRHDVSGVRAHVGGPAAEAAGALGAEAFATGNDVAFRSAPDLHTAAHEAAHVVQQRGGVQLKDGVGRQGDPYEQHADAVADRVVRGESAEGLFDQMAGGGSHGVVQLSPAGDGAHAMADAGSADSAHPAHRPGMKAPHEPPQRQGGQVGAPVGDVDTQSVGEDFARSLSDEKLEQTIEYLIQRRDQPGLESADREAAIDNLAVLAAESDRRGRRSGALDRDAVRTLIRDASAGVTQLGGILKPLANSRAGLGKHPLTAALVERAVDRLAWIVDALGAAVNYMNLASSTGDQDGRALLGMAGTRAHAAQTGIEMLRPWCAFLQLHDHILVLPTLSFEHRCEVLLRQEQGVNELLAQLTLFDPDEAAAAHATVPSRTASLAAAFDEAVVDAEAAVELARRVMYVQAAIDLATFAASLRSMFAMRGPPSAMSFPMPLMVGAGGGAAAMGQIVVSAEWIAAIKHLIEIGAITAAGAAELLRAQGFTHAMAQVSDLPPEVKDMLGEGPTTDGMKVTNASGAGVSRPPRHHVLPKEERKFFEERGFTGDLDIDNFCVELQAAEHQALHGGGDWKLGRTWVGEWNRLVMARLRDLEALLNRKLKLAEVMGEVQKLMKERDLPINFVPYRGEGL